MRKKALGKMIGIYLALIGPLKSLFNIIAGVDFVVTRSQEPGWIGVVGDWIIHPTPTFDLIVFLIGGACLAYLFLSERKTKSITKAATLQSIGRLSISYDQKNPKHYHVMPYMIHEIITIRVAITANQDARRIRLRLEHISPTGPEDKYRRYWGRIFQFPDSSAKETVDCYKDIPQYVDIAVNDLRFNLYGFKLLFQGGQDEPTGISGTGLTLHLLAFGESVQPDRKALSLSMRSKRPHAVLHDEATQN